ncbi:MAG: error-prone DNA polymerase [Rhodospirillaceae bacterium]|nr:error-prone DNA polymerase [Rhodospirillaceae bacterium]
MTAPAYAELQITSNFSFLRGAAHPEELAARAAEIGLAAIAITDRNTLAGVVRAHLAARETGLRLVVGARLDFTDAPGLLCLPTDRAAYGRLSRLITLGRRRAPKGECHIGFSDFLDHAQDQIAIALPPETGLPDTDFADHLGMLAGALPSRSYLAGQNLLRGGDQRRLAALADLAEDKDAPLVATNDVHYHLAARRDAQDVLSSVREHCTIEAAGFHLFPNAERHLKSADHMARLFHRYPDAVARTIHIAHACHFDLSELVYEYPDDEAPPGVSPQEELARLTWEAVRQRYPDGLPEKIRTQLDHELALIDQLNYANYFLTVYDIVRFARSQNILCQGRGSAANSAVCYYLGITAVDPEQVDLLFERFVSAERNEPPDIDVDFEHERREEVIQYIYRKYGRDRAGLAATIIHYRGRSAMRQVAKAMGLTRDVEDALATMTKMRRRSAMDDSHVREIGLDPNEPRLAHSLRIAREITGFPRHLSQHVGGFVITRGRLDEMVPIANAAMEDRTTIEWDKDDLDALGILKVDVLGLGMLTCIRKAFTLIERHYGKSYDLASVPREDPKVYEMLCQADTIGVFQVESRAQMSMLPRLKPKKFYDLVIEVAIVRPGPIQGDMVHPYLRRRDGKEEVDYQKEELRAVLEKTCGVPLFQEQAMRIAIVAAGFTPSEADQLRRAMATFRRLGTIHKYRDRMVEGMTARGYDRDFAERCFKQIEGFGDYGFPESHAASFAHLVYISSWLKYHYPDVFTCALLNSQPMGFYAPAQLVRDARNHDVGVRPVDVNHSNWDCTLESTHDDQTVLRLGFRQVKGLGEKLAGTLIAARDAGNGRPFSDMDDLWRRSQIMPSAIERLARADAFGSMGLTRRRALWDVRRLNPDQLPLFTEMGEGIVEPDVGLPLMAPGEEVSHDYASIRLSLKHHPLALLRAELDPENVIPTAQLAETENGKQVTVAGLVITRQRPGTASGVIFATLEDETGIANVIVWPKLFERYRRETLGSKLLCVTGELQREGIVIHVIARKMRDLTGRLMTLANETNPVLEPPHYAGDGAKRPTYIKPGLYPSRDFH